MEPIVDRCINPDCRGLIRYEEGAREIRCPWCEHAFLAREFEGEYKKINAAMAAGKQAKAALELTVKEKEALQALLNKSQRAWVDNVEIQRHINAKLEDIKADTTAIKRDTGELLGGQTQINETLNDVLEKVPDQKDLERVKTEIAELVLQGVRNEMRRAETVEVVTQVPVVPTEIAPQPQPVPQPEPENPPVVISPREEAEQTEKRTGLRVLFVLLLVVIMIMGLGSIADYISTPVEAAPVLPASTVAAQNVKYWFDSYAGGTVTYLRITWDDAGIEWDFAWRNMTQNEELKVLSEDVNWPQYYDGAWHMNLRSFDAGHTFELFIYPEGDRYDGPTSYRFEYTIPLTLAPERYASLVTGSSLEFGHFEQDNDETNGMEPLSWIVLERRVDAVLVISQHILKVMKYDEDYWNKSLTNTEHTWENSGVRDWLQNVFYLTAFSENERGAIIQWQNDTNGITTLDSIFLVSEVEAGQYFSGNLDRKCRPTIWAERHAGYFGLEKVWWLRDNGFNIAAVKGDGLLGYEYSNSQSCGVRPAMWLDLTKLPQ